MLNENNQTNLRKQGQSPGATSSTHSSTSRRRQTQKPEEVINSIDPNSSFIDFHRVFHNCSADEFRKNLQKIPQHINKLKLSNNNLERFDTNELTQIFKELHQGISTINLSNSNFSSATKFITVMHNLPQKIDEIIIDDEKLGALDIMAISSIFKSIPNKVTLFELRHFNLNRFDKKDLIKIFADIPNSVTKLTLNQKDPIPATKVCNILTSLPRLDIHLHFYHEECSYLKYYYQLTHTDNLKNTTIKIDIAKLKEFPLELITFLLNKLPENVNYIDFQYEQTSITWNLTANPILKSNPEVHSLIIKIINAKDYLDLQNNDLGNPEVHTIFPQLLQMMPKNTKFLDLRNNQLSTLDGDKLKKILNAIPESVTSTQYTDDIINTKNNHKSESPSKPRSQDDFSPYTLLINAIDAARKVAAIAENDAKVIAIKKFTSDMAEQYKKECENKTLPIIFKDYSNEVLRKCEKELGVEHGFIRALRDIINILTFVLFLGAYNMYQNKKEFGSYFNLLNPRQKMYNHFKSEVLGNGASVRQGIIFMPTIQLIKNHGDFGVEIVIETERCVIRTVTTSDIPHYLRLFEDSDVMANYGTGKPKSSPEEKAALQQRVESWINRWKSTPTKDPNKAYDPYNGMAVFAKLSGDFIGHVVIGRSGIETNDNTAISEIAYLFHKAYWRQGYGTEVVSATVELANKLANENLLDGKKLTKLTATTKTTHTASQNILEKNGFFTDKKVDEKFGAQRFIYEKTIADVKSELSTPKVLSKSEIKPFTGTHVVGQGENRALILNP